MADISKITTLDGQTHNIKDSTARSTANSKSTVVANPTLAGTESELASLQIDNVKYKLGGGGGIQHMTLAEYNQLTQEEKMADVVYCIVDDETEVEFATKAELATKQDLLTFDDIPTANSSKPVKSSGIKAALDAKQNTLTFDNTPTASSTNPVTSGGVFSAIAAVKPVAFQKTLSSSGWSSSAQTLSDTKFLTGNYIYLVQGAPSSNVAYNEAQIYADDVIASGQMTFHCQTTPSTNLTVTILRLAVAS